MTRQFLIERIIREVYGSQPSDDRTISDNMVNSFINDAIALAAKTNYKENNQIEGVGYVNNSFYTTFKNISITSDSRPGYYNATLPQVPIGLGRNEGIGSLRINSAKYGLSYAFIPLSEAQAEYMDTLPQPNGIFYWNEGNQLVMKSKLNITNEKLTLRMVSGGDSTDKNSNLNVPDEWLPMMEEYIVKKCIQMRMQPKDLVNDGTDNL